MTHRSDAGTITLGRLFGIGFVVFFACLLFLVVDVRHRMGGYQAVNGQGIAGTVTATNCESHLFGRLCTGNFVSADGKIRLPDMRINGAKTASAQALPAVIAKPDTAEAWTADGSPWLTVSAVQLATLVPVIVVLAMIWTLLIGGPHAWRAQGQAMRARHARDRANAHAREVRLGRVH